MLAANEGRPRSSIPTVISTVRTAIAYYGVQLFGDAQFRVTPGTEPVFQQFVRLWSLIVLGVTLPLVADFLRRWRP